MSDQSAESEGEEWPDLDNEDNQYEVEEIIRQASEAPSDIPNEQIMSKLQMEINQAMEYMNGHPNLKTNWFTIVHGTSLSTDLTIEILALKFAHLEQSKPLNWNHKTVTITFSALQNKLCKLSNEMYHNLTFQEMLEKHMYQIDVSIFRQYLKEGICTYIENILEQLYPQNEAEQEESKEELKEGDDGQINTEDIAVDDEALAALLGKGYDFYNAKQALVRANSDMSKALKILNDIKLFKDPQYRNFNFYKDNINVIDKNIATTDNPIIKLIVKIIERIQLIHNFCYICLTPFEETQFKINVCQAKRCRDQYQPPISSSIIYQYQSSYQSSNNNNNDSYYQRSDFNSLLNQANDQQRNNQRSSDDIQQEIEKVDLKIEELDLSFFNQIKEDLDMTKFKLAIAACSLFNYNAIGLCLRVLHNFNQQANPFINCPTAKVQELFKNFIEVKNEIKQSTPEAFQDQLQRLLKINVKQEKIESYALFSTFMQMMKFKIVKLQVETMLDIDQYHSIQEYIVINTDKEKEEAFQKKKEKFKSEFVFYGCSYEEWFSTLAGGIKQDYDGRIKTSQQFENVIFDSCKNSEYIQNNIKCLEDYNIGPIVAICEIIKTNDHTTSLDGAYTYIYNKEDIVIRYLLELIYNQNLIEIRIKTTDIDLEKHYYQRTEYQNQEEEEKGEMQRVIKKKLIPQNDQLFQDEEEEEREEQKQKQNEVMEMIEKADKQTDDTIQNLDSQMEKVDIRDDDDDKEESSLI